MGQFSKEIPLKKSHEILYRKSLVNCWGNSPTCPKFNTHKKVVVHFFPPMLLVPKTPPLTYPNMRRFKGPKMDSLTSLHFHFTSSQPRKEEVDSGDQRKF